MPSSPRRTEHAPNGISFRSRAARRFLCLAACALAVAGLAGCGPAPGAAHGAGPNLNAEARPRTATELEPGSAFAELWFYLREGRFEEIPGPTGIPPAALRPWTIQERIAAFAELDGRAYLAVNGYGVVGLRLSPSDFPRFQPHYDPLLFRYRTLTQMLPRQGSLLCHVYFNSLLNETSAEALQLRGISLLELFPEDGVYRHRTPPFQRRNPQWECVGLALDAEEGAILAWKHSTAQETRFAYTRLDLTAGSEQTATQDAYRDALAFVPFDGQVDPALRAVAEAAAQLLRSPSTAIGVQFLVQRAGSHRDGRFQILPPEFGSSERITLLTLAVEEREGRFTLLTPDGTVLWSREGSSRVGRRRLPRLPKGFVYSDLLLFESFVLAAWEQRVFTGVGAAGLFISKDPELSP